MLKMDIFIYQPVYYQQTIFPKNIDKEKSNASTVFLIFF